jgi:hypothetical protein
MRKTKLKETLIREFKTYLPQLILEILKDPDFGLEIRKDIKKKLEKLRKNKVKFFSEEEVRKRIKV